MPRKNLGKIHENIKAIRKEKGLTQKEMSKHLQIAESTYSRLEKGKIDIAYQRHLLPIAQIFEMEIEDLFVYKNDNYIKSTDLNEIRQVIEKLKNFF